MKRRLPEKIKLTTNKTSGRGVQSDDKQKGEEAIAFAMSMNR